MERIQRIEEARNFRPEGADEWESHDGFRIVTDEQTITLSISNGQSCCESWGYLMSEDDLGKFVGAELRGIELTDTNLTARNFTSHWSPIEGSDMEHLDQGDVMFVDILTDRGVLQFAAYNSHNGYYGHAARIASKQLTHEEGL